MDASRESLLIYWLHLITIFGAFWGGKSLALIIGKTLNAFEATGVTIFLIASMIAYSKKLGMDKKEISKVFFAWCKNTGCCFIGCLFYCLEIIQILYFKNSCPICCVHFVWQ